MEKFGDGRDWFFENRFGLFVHWGIYSVGAFHEQHQHVMGLTRSDYKPFMEQFNPVKYKPDEWLDMAQAAGMSYIVFTTKHIDGFCMFDSQYTDYKVTNTPYKKDTLKELADACHRRNFKLCLYYSCVDMNHPNYPSAGRSYELPSPEPGDEPDIDKYIEYVKNQVRELCTNYGEIHGFWWDGNVLKHNDPSINEIIRSLQPKAVINDRGFSEGDFGTPERDWYDYVNTDLVFEKPTEQCQSIGYYSWGYKWDESYYTLEYLTQSIDKIMAKGGNYLLNVGPKPDGAMPIEGEKILREIGVWYHTVKETFIDAVPATNIIGSRDVLLTKKDNTLYVHLYKKPINDAVYLKPLQKLPVSARLMNTGAMVETDITYFPHKYDEDLYLRLTKLPIDQLGSTVPIIKLEFDSLD